LRGLPGTIPLLHRGQVGAMVRLLLRCLVAMTVACSPLGAQAQQFPSRVIRIVVGSDQSSPADIISRLIAAEVTESEGWRVVIENRPGASYTISARRSLAARGRAYDLGVGAPRVCCTGIVAESRLAHRCRVHGPYQADDLAQCFGRSSFRSCQFGVRTRYASQAQSRQTHFFLWWLWNACSHHWRNVQATSWTAGVARPLSWRDVAGSDRPAQRHQPVSVHHDASGHRADRRRPVEGPRCYRVQARTCAERRSDHGRAGISRAGGGGLDRLCRQERNAAGNPDKAQFRTKQGARETEDFGGLGENGRGAGRRDGDRIRSPHEGSDQILEGGCKHYGDHDRTLTG